MTECVSTLFPVKIAWGHGLLNFNNNSQSLVHLKISMTNDILPSKLSDLI